VRRLPDKVEEFDDEVIDIDSLGNDQSKVKRRLEPATEEDQVGESIL
jgi:hypothetical protein